MRVRAVAMRFAARSAEPLHWSAQALLEFEKRRPLKAFQHSPRLRASLHHFSDPPDVSCRLHFQPSERRSCQFLLGIRSSSVRRQF